MMAGSGVRHLGVLAVPLMLLVLPLVKRTFSISDRALPTLGQLASETRDLVQLGLLSAYAAETLSRVGAGVIIAVAIAVPLGLLIGRSRVAVLAADWYLQFILGVSAIAWLPLAVIWLGRGERTMMVVIVYSAALPLVVNVMRGMRSVPAEYGTALKTLGASRFRIIRDVYLWGSAGSVIAGTRLSLGFAWRAAIGGEMLLGLPGIGFMISSSRQTADTPRIVVGMLVIGFLYILTDRLIMGSIEALTVGRWAPAVTR
jgi:ABC-type nitrate/sulfonate/bicarbonate transport system permease component